MWNDFNDMPKLIAGMLKSKEGVIRAIINDIEESNKLANGIKKCSNSVIDNPSEENLRKMINTTMKCVSKQSAITTRLCIIALMYCGGSNYDRDAATILNKFGYGKQALQEMFKTKLEGFRK